MTTPLTQAEQNSASIDAFNEYIKSNPDVTMGVRVTWRLGESSASVPMHIFNALGVTPQMLMQPELWFYDLVKGTRGIFELQAFGADSKPVGGVFKLKRDTGLDQCELNIAAMFQPGWQGPPPNGVRTPRLERDKLTGQPIPPITAVAPIVPPAFQAPPLPVGIPAGATADPAVLQAYHTAARDAAASAAEVAQLRQTNEAIRRELESQRLESARRDADEKRRAEVDAVKRDADRQIEALRNEMRARPTEPLVKGPAITDIVAAIGTAVTGLAAALTPTLLELRKDAAARDDRAREQERIAREDANRRADEATKRADAAAKAQYDLTLEMIKKPADQGNTKMFEGMVTVQAQITNSMLQFLEMKSQYEGNDAPPAWMPLAEKLADTAEKLIIAQQSKVSGDRLAIARIAADKLETERRVRIEAAKQGAAGKVQQVPKPPQPAASQPAPTAPAAQNQAAGTPAAGQKKDEIVSITKILKMSIMSHGDANQIAKVVVEALKGDRPEYIAFQEELEKVYGDDYELMLNVELGEEWIKTPANAYYLANLKQIVEAAVAADPELISEEDGDDDDGDEPGPEPKVAAEATVEAQVVAQPTTPAPPVVNGEATEKPKRQRKSKAAEPTTN